jgi:hypothetical protein
VRLLADPRRCYGPEYEAGATWPGQAGVRLLRKQGALCLRERCDEASRGDVLLSLARDVATQAVDARLRPHEASMAMRCSNGVPSNKGLKLTKSERIGALQLNPGVGPTTEGARPRTEAGTQMPTDCGPEPAADGATNS